VTNSYLTFEAIMEDTKNSSSLYYYLKNYVRPPYDCSDILRWQWAQSVSALDKLIHDLVRVGMLEIFQGNRAITAKFLEFQIPFQVHSQMCENPTIAYSILEREIVRKHSFLAFQEPNKISDALAYIWDEPHKWTVLAQALNISEPKIKTQLKNISIRRNQIVHEGDYSSNLLQRQTIDENDVAKVLNFILDLGEAIYNLVCLKTAL
jgi:hypothetical protein